MKKIIIALAVTAGLAGCVNGEFDSERSSALRTWANSQVEAYNNAHIDPLQLPQEQLAVGVMACGTLSGIATVWNPNVVEASTEANAWCSTLSKALGKAK